VLNIAGPAEQVGQIPANYTVGGNGRQRNGRGQGDGSTGLARTAHDASHEPEIRLRPGAASGLRTGLQWYSEAMREMAT
jgi:hypothetical protein